MPKPWFTVDEIAPWQYEGTIEVFRAGWRCSRLFDTWDRIDKRLDMNRIIWRPARANHPTLATDLTVQAALHEVALRNSSELFESTPENPFEID